MPLIIRLQQVPLQLSHEGFFLLVDHCVVEILHHLVLKFCIRHLTLLYAILAHLAFLKGPTVLVILPWYVHVCSAQYGCFQYFLDCVLSWYVAKCFLNDCEIVSVAPVITGVTFVFTFHMHCISVVRS